MDEALPTTIDSYDDAVQWIYDRINYERVRPKKTSTHFRLERVEKLLEVIGSPQQRIPAVHIAGTKGKGSTAAMLHSILKASGVRSGLFTSPHIELFEERMRVDGDMPTQDELTELVVRLERLLAAADPELVADGPTYFEVATLLAWMFFDAKDVELVVLETGLGGRLDCTNVCTSVITIITSIGLDHTDVLGDTIPLITSEKAGIMKPGVPLLTWVDQPEAIDVLRLRSQELGCRVSWRDRELSAVVKESTDDTGQQIDVTVSDTVYADLHLPLLGKHQAGNLALAVAAANYLSREDDRITAESIAAGVRQLEWPLRFEILNDRPPVVLDAAHNPDSIAAFIATCRQHFPKQPRTLIFASSRDKDAAAMLKILASEFDQIILTQFEHNPRAVPIDQLKAILQTFSIEDNAARPQIRVAETPREALAAAKQSTPEDGVICCAGSIFIAAELRTLLMSNAV